MKKTLRLYLGILTATLVMLFCSNLLDPVLAQPVSPLVEALDLFSEGKISASEAVRMQLVEFENRINSNPHAHKCATPVTIMAHKHWGKLSEGVKAEYQKVFNSSSVLATQNYVSPSGKFRIQYETTGPDAVPLADNNSNSVPDYVEWVGEAADSSYRHEIITLGFTDPIPNGQQYLVILADLEAYGLTRPSAGSPGGTIIEIENDFVGFPKNTDPEGDQKGAIKVTMAHEFKHAIQFTQNGWSGDVDRWLEMDATLMEEVVYDNVNDYYNYIDGFSSDLFSSASTTLIPGSYEDVTWAIYFHERFGELFWTKVWDRIEANNSIGFLTAINQELTVMGFDFQEVVLESYMWHFASNSSFSSSNYGFKEAAFYPPPLLTETYDTFFFDLPPARLNSKFSAKYFLFETQDSSDGLLAFNYTATSTDVQIGLLIYSSIDNSIEPYFITSITPDLEQTINTKFEWSDIDKIGIVVVNTNQNLAQNFSFSISDYFVTGTDTVVIRDQFELSQNFPNPFNPSTSIQVTLPKATKVSLTVYDYMGRKVQTIFEGTLNRGFHNLPFNGNQYPSGVYFYQLRTENGAITKKMTLLK